MVIHVYSPYIDVYMCARARVYMCINEKFNHDEMKRKGLGDEKEK